MWKTLVLILTVVLITPVFTTSIQPSQSDQWREYLFQSTGIVIYDYDGDSVDEIVTLPFYVIDNYVPLKSPYAEATTGFTLDIDIDGDQELVLRMGDLFYFYERTREVMVANICPGRVIIDPFFTSFSCGNKVFYNKTIYTFETSPLFTVAVLDRLYVVYLRGDNIFIKTNFGWEKTIYGAGMRSIHGVGLVAGNIYILGAGPVTGSILLIYSIPDDTYRTVGFTTEFDYTVAFVPVDVSFIAVKGDRIYRVNPDRVVLEGIGTFLYYDQFNIYIFNEPNTVTVYNIHIRTVVRTVTTPTRPVVLGGKYPYIAYSDYTRTYVLSLLPPVDVSIHAPGFVYAGERFYYYISAVNAVESTLFLNNTRIPNSGFLVLNRSGTYVFRAYATNGVIEVEREHYLLVEPRPLVARLNVHGDTRAFSRVNLTVETVDGLTGRPVTVSCSVVSGGRNFTAWTWKPVEISLTPRGLTDTLFPVTVACGDNTYYKHTTVSRTLTLQPVRPIIVLEYLGGGEVYVTAYSPDGSVEAPGRVSIEVNYMSVGEYVLPAKFRVQPGNNTVLVKYTSTVPVFEHTIYIATIEYYRNASEVPFEKLRDLIVADVVEYRNITVEIPVEKPIYIPVEKVKTEADIQTIVSTGLVGFSAGFAVAGLLLKLKTRRRSPKKEEPIASVEMEET